MCSGNEKRKLKIDPDVLEQAFLNQVVEDDNAGEYEAYSEMFQKLLLLDGAEEIIYEYLSMNTQERIIEGKFNLKY